MTMKITLAEIADTIGAELSGAQGDCKITGLNTLEAASSGEISFLANKSYQKQLAATAASAVILHPDMAQASPVPVLTMANPYAGFAKVSQMFNNLPSQPEGIHPSAVVAESAQIDDKVSIAANVVIGEHVVIGRGSRIGPGSVISDNSVIGDDCILHANVTIYHDVTIGNQCILHSGSVIGADGFGFAPDQGEWVKIIQLGGVRIGNKVEVGANTTIDRGALGDTIIGNGVILDNQIMIAHNVEIGDGCAFAATSGVAGSTKSGKHCTIAGGAGIAGHLTLADGVHITAMTLVSKSITEPGAYSSGTAMMPAADWRKSATRFRQLDAMAKRLTKLEKGL